MKGYLLGFVIFIAGIPTLMWWVSGMPEFIGIPAWRMCIAVLLALAGLALSVWSIIYMKHVGDGNPFDAMGHEVDPRTKHLMTDGPYRHSRNPMLSGTYLYYIGIMIALWSWWALVVFACVFLLMTLQVRSEEKRLEADFGDEYLKYKKSTGRFLPFCLILIAALIAGCEEISEGRIVDWAPVNIYIEAVDNNGNSIISPDMPGMTLTFKDSVYTVQNEDSIIHTRAYMAIMKGLVARPIGGTDGQYQLVFGEIDGAADMDEDILLNWPDGSRDIIHYHCSNHSERKLSCNRSWKLNGQPHNGSTFRFTDK